MRDLTHDHDFGCDAARDALPDLLHGRLTGEARARAERHAAACDGCAAELALLRGARDLVRAGAPALDLAAVAAAVRAATVPAARPERADTADAPRLVAPPRMAAPSRWRVGRSLRALAATVLVAVGAGAVWRGLGGPNVVPGAGTAAAPAPAVVADGTPAAAASDTPGTGAVTSSTTPGRGPTPAVLAAAEPGLGARFDDLSDEELQAVIAAVEGSDRALPSAEPDPAAPDVGGGG